MEKKGKIVGIGGIFFKTKETEATKQWYNHHMGLNVDQYGAGFRFLKPSNHANGYLQWSVFPEDTNYFINPSQSFMINYRVSNLEDLLLRLKNEGVEVVEEISIFDYGKFSKIKDLNGQIVELWEPVDKVFDEYYNASSINEE